MSIFNHKQAAANAQVIDDIRAAEKLLAGIHETVAARSAVIVALEQELGVLAIAVADGANPKAANEKVGELDAARSALRLSQAALAPAQKRLADAHHAQRRHVLGDHIKLVNKFNDRRLKFAREIATAVAALNAAWEGLHKANKDLSIMWPGAQLPLTSITSPQQVLKVVSFEMFRLGGHPPRFGGTWPEVPSIPGAIAPDIRSTDPASIKPLVEEIELSNKLLLAALEHVDPPAPTPISDFAPLPGPALHTAEAAEGNAYRREFNPEDLLPGTHAFPPPPKVRLS